MIDLHIHSTASDGTLTPAQILAQAITIGLRAFSITDHDTLRGVQALESVQIPAQMGFISGIELSTSTPKAWGIAGSLHILGYGVDSRNPELLRTLAILRESRDQRALKIITRLKQLGVVISSRQVAEIAGVGVAGRPHVALALVQAGHVADISEAFEKYLAHGRPAYVQRYRIDAVEGIGLIRAAGGVAVLAHPGVYFGDDADRMALVTGALQKMGLAGIEAYYPEHTAVTVSACRQVARQMGLLLTGGTDFHGAIRPAIKMGFAEGAMRVPDALFDRLQAAVTTLSKASSVSAF